MRIFSLVTIFALAAVFLCVDQASSAGGPIVVLRPPRRGRRETEPWEREMASVETDTPGAPTGDTGARGGALPSGCTSRAGATVTVGSPAGDRVALSFDDGPSVTQTPPILATLKRLHGRATFFEEGRHVHGREELMREILAAGDEIGNHSYHHPEYPGNGELAATDQKIREAVGFEPCLFRPPYGLIDAKVTAAARRNGLEMVLWTLDSEDDHHPGVAAIVHNVVEGATPGAIILMHDGGHHPQTVRALPAVIKGLRARGLHFATVTELLGGRMIYRHTMRTRPGRRGRRPRGR
ncbi:MAG TPA: polysaccharide deacetylase family protein [Solirubrobacterales bacterium]|nr:polysaccharide deacetylase family protein [Solirubrobacterales bacterium]